MDATLIENARKLAPFHLMDTPSLLLWGALNVAFLVYYVKRLRDVGPLSLDTYFVVRFLYIPIVFMFPFAFSEMNVVISGQFAAPARSFLEPTFMVGVIGIAAFVAGGVIHKYIPFRVIGFDYCEASFRELWTTRRGVLAGAAISLGLMAVLLGLGLEFGKARQTALQAPILRPLFNVWHTIHPFVVLNALVYAFVNRSTVAYAFGLLLALAGIFGETRQASIEPLAIFLALVCFYFGKRVKLRQIVPVGVAVVLVAVYLVGIRFGQYGAPQFSRLMNSALYGSQFNDLRDTAAMMSGWDGRLLLGRTHAAALMAFVPSYLSTFREENKFPKFTLKTCGFIHEKDHPGLRPIIFGESYFNYSIPGVILVGLLSGVLVFKLADLVQLRTSQSTDRRDMTTGLTAVTYLGFLLCALHTSAFFGVYVVVFLLVAGRLLSRYRPMTSLAP